MRTKFLLAAGGAALLAALALSIFRGDGEPAYTVVNGEDFESVRRQLYSKTRYTVIDIPNERRAVEQIPDDVIEREVDSQRFASTLGPLPPSGVSEVRILLQSAIQGIHDALYAAYEKNDLEEVANLGVALATRRAQLASLEKGEYVTLYQDQKLFKHQPPGYQIVTRFVHNTEVDGRSIKAVFVLSEADFPEIRAARKNQEELGHYLAAEAASTFNGLSDEMRKETVELFDRVREGQAPPDDGELKRNWALLKRVRWYGGHFDRVRYLAYPPGGHR